MPAPRHLDTQADKWMDVAVAADGRQEHLQVCFPRCIVA
jgi:hypothetical protein